MAIGIETAQNAVKTVCGNYLSRFENDMRTTALTSILAAALRSINEHKPLTKHAVLTLKAGEQLYPAPGDLIGIGGTSYGQSQLQQDNNWQVSCLRNLPSLRKDRRHGQLMIRLSSVPSVELISVCGGFLDYAYYAEWTLDTLPAAALNLIELGAQLEVASREQFSAMTKTLGEGHKHKTQLNPAQVRDHLAVQFIDACERATWAS